MTPFLQSLSDKTDPATPAVYLVETKRARRDPPNYLGCRYQVDGSTIRGHPFTIEASGVGAIRSGKPYPPIPSPAPSRTARGRRGPSYHQSSPPTKPEEPDLGYISTSTWG